MAGGQRVLQCRTPRRDKTRGTGTPRRIIFAVIFLSLCSSCSAKINWREGLKWVADRLLSRSHRVSHVEVASAVLRDGRVTVVDGIAAGPALGRFLDSDFTTSGFGKLWVSSRPGYSVQDQMYGAGLVEGYLTAVRIHDHYTNMVSYFKRSYNLSSLNEAFDWLDRHDEWLGQLLNRKSRATSSSSAAAANLTESGEGYEFHSIREEGPQQQRRQLQGEEEEGRDGEEDGQQQQRLQGEEEERRRADEDGRQLLAAVRLTDWQLSGLVDGYNLRAAGSAAAADENFAEGSWLTGPRFREGQQQGNGGEEEGVGSRGSRGKGQRQRRRRRPLPRMTRTQILMLSSVGDMDDILEAVQQQRRKQHQQQWGHTGTSSTAADDTQGSIDGQGGATDSDRGEEIDPGGRYARMSPEELQVELASRGKCSALIKVTGDLSDLLIGHSAWFTYSGMTRVYKHYCLDGLPGNKAGSKAGSKAGGGADRIDPQMEDEAWEEEEVQASSRCASFSSYAGELASDDDFYILDSGLVVLQTTNDVYNKTMYVTGTRPEALLNWQRVRAANLLATGGKHWARLVGLRNSGTLNSQYMVLDLSRFMPGGELMPGLLWVVEQAPGMTLASDQTATLERGYWPSYNVPFHPEMYEAMGYRALAKQLLSQSHLGPAAAAAASANSSAAAAAAVAADGARSIMGLSYQLAPRAKIFRRDHGRVKDLGSLKDLLRSNNWRHDPYSNGSPANAICGRCDLDPKHPKPYGCIDTKVTSYGLAMDMQSEAVAGPTTAGGQLPEFTWGGGGDGSTWGNAAHQGERRRWRTGFERMGWVAPGHEASPPDEE